MPEAATVAAAVPRHAAADFWKIHFLRSAVPLHRKEHDYRKCGLCLRFEPIPTLNRTEFSLWRGNGGTSGSQVSPTTYQVIYKGNPDTATQAGASTNSVVTRIGDVNGTSTRFTRTAPLLAREFFRVADLGPASPILAEGFESGDGGFTSVNKGSGTVFDSVADFGQGSAMHQLTSLALAALLAAVGSVGAAPSARPDILLLMPDQMRGDCLSVLGHPAVRTPNFDRLARDGVLFRRAYSTVPSCIPARFALLTGLAPQTSGVVGFAAKPITTPTLPGVLGEAGYATVLVGRNMHQVPASNTCGYQQQVFGSTYVNDDDYDRDLKQSAPDAGGIGRVIAGLGLTCNGWGGKPWPLADALHPTAWVVRQSRKVVAATGPDQPLFLTASFYAPHPPLFPPGGYFEKYMKTALPAPAHGDWVDWGALSSGGDKAGHRVRLEGEDLRTTQAGYFGLIEQLDDEVAPLMAEFKARSEKAGRSWVIVVTSDHGEMLGDHGFFRKCEPFEGSANIPLMMAGSPGLGFKAGMRSMQPVCLEDLMPTLVELAGAKPPERLDGVSLVAGLRGGNLPTREWLHFEHAPCYSKEQAFHALTNGHYKYIWRPADGTEHLFDLDHDSREERDLAKVAAERGLLESWRGRLVRRLAGRPEGFSDGTKLIPGRPYPALQHQPIRP